MGANYNLLGRSIPPHYLSLATIGAVVLLAAPKPWAPAVKKEAEINASSKEEEAFVKAYLEKHL
ncbi:uncharacterized protein C5L36_0D01280 [Pichia kudriavzevii]|uniref:ATP synthase subunit K, mitochondrial n=1 Tax=Pichia kudriavzevii TaxID=4909 RepID=A0A2U9R807_PICKU|nr:uncharacterized protein C5L36_0D01280 [Pichia kudriavzevii]AWU77391.1 hypothetical protein C5L36_0D01280 [Pichia kudriavzevii]